MPEVAPQRGRNIVIAVVFAGVVALAAFTILRSTGEDSAAPINPGPAPTTAVSPTATGTPSKTTPKPSRKPKTAPPTPVGCDDGREAFNLDGKEVQSLLPDCGSKPVTVEQQKSHGLGLGCGGNYPTILYKTTTHAGSKASVCGTNSSGEKFRLVTQPKGGQTIDLPGSYDPALDAFVADDGATTYRVLAYNGTLEIVRGGKVQKQTSDNWITLDNESDYD